MKEEYEKKGIPVYDLSAKKSKVKTGLKFSTGKPIAYTIHWTGEKTHGQTPYVVADWWAREDGEASAHFIVKDSDILQFQPIDAVVWHAGEKHGNMMTLGIEVIPKDLKGEFSMTSIETLRELLNYLDKKLYPEGNVKLPVVRHYDWSGKDCPRFYVDEGEWHKLKLLLGRA